MNTYVRNMPQHRIDNEFLRWQQAEGFRHALDGLQPYPDQTIQTLCGTEVTVRRTDFPRIGKCIGPTCLDCERIWRERIGAAQPGARA